MKTLTIILIMVSINATAQQTEKQKRSGYNVIPLQRKNFNTSTCGMCGLPWTHCESKPVKMTENISVFALCTYCWNHCTVDERIMFHKVLFKQQEINWPEAPSEFTYQDIDKAVRQASIKL